MMRSAVSRALRPLAARMGVAGALLLPILFFALAIVPSLSSTPAAAQDGDVAAVAPPAGPVPLLTAADMVGTWLCTDDEAGAPWGEIGYRADGTASFALDATLTIKGVPVTLIGSGEQTWSLDGAILREQITSITLTSVKADGVPVEQALIDELQAQFSAYGEEASPITVLDRDTFIEHGDAHTVTCRRQT